MREVGVSELRARTAVILREVREQQAQYTITRRGKPVGILAPIAEARANSESGKDGWDEFFRLADLLASTPRRSRKTSTELLSEMRR